MLSLEVGSFVKCAECSTEAEITSTSICGGTTSYLLSCDHRNAYCESCDAMARDVSDTIREVHVFCDPCVARTMESYAEEPQYQTTKKKVKYPKPKPSYTMQDLRVVHKRSHQVWTEDEGIALGLFIKKKSALELSQMFNRQASAFSPDRCKKSASRIAPDSAIRYLGTEIICKSCKYKTPLSYFQLEHVSKKLNKPVVMLVLFDVLEAAKSFKCNKCGEKNVQFDIKLFPDNN